MQSPRRLIVAITGATGVDYGIAVLRLLRRHGGFETHLIISPSAIRTLAEESDVPLAEVQALADVRHPFKDIGATIASGSFRTEGMIVAPCSSHTLSAIAASLGDNLILRAADVCLKERRRLLLMLRETPLHLGHIEHMAAVTRYGAIVMPPVPSLYTRPQSIAEMVEQTAARALDVMGIETEALHRWGDASGREG
ncbi:UbiX family flavin prenyltransferase [Sphingomonas sp.]|jgi:4-hydroxy-3-polyprenylbenzoate decarboxylase|uniref:UbiX family flavin prenyltransferase n=1 Tax=Sphingomonas sp. TaxID=28214 RepID=UPI0035C80F38